MPRPTLHLEPFKNAIAEMLAQGSSWPHIVEYLRTEHNIRVHVRTLRGRADEWNLPRPRRRQVIEDTPELRQQIQTLFFEYCLDDTAIYERLKQLDFPVSLRGIVRIRRSMGLRRRRSPEEIEELRERLRKYFEEDEDANTILRSMGRSYLYVHLRQRMFNAPRDLMWSLYTRTFPQEVADRKNRLQRRRGGYTTMGPNYIWSVDGYLKLEFFGIEIYAAIDAYSRFITWFYVGVSARTCRVVLAQYVQMVTEYGFLPQAIRADRGTETKLLAGAHYYLSFEAYKARLRQRRLQQSAAQNSPAQGTPPPLKAEPPSPRLQENFDPNIEPSEDIFPLADCFVFGKSTFNVKIESWWTRLCEGRSLFWREYLGKLSSEGLFTKGNLSDQISILFIYMPRIRWEFADFVRQWNSHYIRKQSNRPHVQPGRPYLLYHLPEQTNAQECRVPVEPESLRQLQNVVEQDGIDLDAYLPRHVLDICEGFITAQGHSLPLQWRENDNQGSPWLDIYMALRTSVRRYIDERKMPALCLLDRYTLGGESALAFLHRMGISVDELEQAEPAETMDGVEPDDGNNES